MPDLSKLKLAAVLAAAMVAAASCGSSSSDSNSSDTTVADKSETSEASTDASGGETATDEDDPSTGIVGEGMTVRINWSGFPENWLPGGDWPIGYLRTPYENLVNLDADGNVVPELAESWEQTNDTTLTFSLRAGVVFHDGTPFNADAVKASLEAIQSAESDIAGPIRVVSKVEVIDDLTVALHTDQPSPSLLLTMTTLGALMYSPAAIDAGTLLDEPVGTGPWAYNADASSGTSLTFDFFPEYWDGRDSVGFDTIELFAIADDNAQVAALETGQVDLTYTTEAYLADFEAKDGFGTLKNPVIRNGMMFFDRGPGGIFEDVSVRQAACYAMDNEATGAFIGALPQTQTFLEGQIGHAAGFEGFPHSLEKAAELMDQAGNPSIAGESLATFFTEDVVTIYLDQMNKLDGFDMSVQVVPPPQWFGQWDTGQYPLGVGSQPELHPSDWYHRYWAADAPANPAGAESDELKAAAEAAIAAGVSSDADALWTEVSRVVHQDALTCGRLTGVDPIVWNSETLSGVEPSGHIFEPKLINYKALRPAS